MILTSRPFFTLKQNMKITEDRKITIWLSALVIATSLFIVFSSCKSSKDANCDAYSKTETKK
jgi:preprotein translocase subunit SecG